jgi:hypothetical protein
MTDIVERLRAANAWKKDVLVREAAEYIERLRAALKTVREENDRAKRQFTNVSNKILDEACRILGSK